MSTTAQPDPGTPEVETPESETAEDIWADIDKAEVTGAPLPPEKEGREEGDPEPEAEVQPETTQPAQDPWQNVPPEAKAAFDEAQRRLVDMERAERITRGRLSALQRKLNEQQSQIAPKDDRAPLDERIKRVAEDYPEVAEPLLAKLGALENDVGELRNERAYHLQQRIEAEASQVRARHPDYQEVLKAHPQEFEAWVFDRRQPAWVREAAARNAQDIVDAGEVNLMMDYFKQSIGLAPPPGTEPTPDPSRTGRRQRQLEGSVSPSTRAAVPALSGVPEEGDPEEIWKAIDREEARAQRR